MVGYSYTWKKSKEVQIFVEEKLDKVLASSAWHSAFANAYVQNEETTSSDHSTICLKLGNPKAPYSPKFRFENAWIREEECRYVIARSWERHSYPESDFCLWRGSSDLGQEPEKLV